MAVAAENGCPEGLVTTPAGNARVQKDAVNGAQFWRKLRGVDAFGWTPVVPSLPVPALTTATPSMGSFGDSFTAGNGAVPGTASYVNVIAAALGAAVTNFAVGGTGVYTAIASLYALGATFAPRNPSYTLITWMAGFNDLRRNGSAAKTIAKIQSCLRAFIALSFSGTSIAASDAAVTKVGAWTNFTPAGGQTRGAAIAGNALSGVSGMTASWNFNGDSLIIGTFVSDGVTYIHGPATITVDGVLVQTYNPDQLTDNIADSAYDNGRVPAAIVIRGLGSGAHTVVIAPTHATRPFIVDYLSTLVAPGDALPLLVAVPARMNATGYATAPASATDAVMAVVASAIIDVVNEFPDYPIRSVWPNSQYDLTTGVSADNIHPNNVGHLQIAKAFLYAIQTSIVPFMRGSAANTTQVGRAAKASAASATAVGDNAQATAANSTAIGTNSTSSNGGVAVGSSASATGVTTVAVGTSAAAPATDGVAIGANAAITGAGSASSTVVGSGASSSNTNVTAVGKGANSNSDRGTAVGAVATVTAANGTAVGSNTTVAHATSTAIGKGATTTAVNQVMLGTATETVVAPGNATIGGAGKTVSFYGIAGVARAAAIATPTAPSAGYVQAEAASAKTAIDAIRVALQNIGVTL